MDFEVTEVWEESDGRKSFKGVTKIVKERRRGGSEEKLLTKGNGVKDGKNECIDFKKEYFVRVRIQCLAYEVINSIPRTSGKKNFGKLSLMYI